MHTYGIYRRGLRHLAKRLKDGKQSAINRTAELFARDLPFFAVVVPMPSHGGRATVMLDVARNIAALRPDVRVCDILASEPHDSMYEAKKNGARMPSVTMRLIANPPADKCYVIDNVIDTGTTFNAVARVLQGAELYAIATTRRNEK